MSLYATLLITYLLTIKVKTTLTVKTVINQVYLLRKVKTW